MRCAAIDIGTVTCRLLVADVDDAGIHELYRESAITNLGEGVDATGMLAPAAIERVCEKAREYVEAIARYSSADNPVVVRTMATSASRDAANAQEFAARMQEVGIDLSVIPGGKEAELSFLGASADFAGQRLLVSDVGGGSTELVAGVAGEGIVHAHSFNIGCRRALERVLLADPPTKGQMDSLAQWASEEFASFFDQLDAQGFAPERYVAVAGTATSAVSMDRKIDPYDPALVHGQEVTQETLEELLAWLSAMTVEQRKQVVGLQPRRAPLIVAGLIITLQVVKMAGLGAYTASESDILEGIVYDAYRSARA